MAAPSQTHAIVEEIRHIASELTAHKSGLDEFKRVLDPTRTYIKDLRQTNMYWLENVLAGAGRYPQQLEWSRTIEKDYASITSQEIAALARRYLVWDHASVVVISPEKNSTQGPMQK